MRQNNIIPLLLAGLCFVIGCTGIYDNVKEFGSAETIYAGKLDGVQRIKYGFERIEVDLYKQGRVPASEMNLGRSTRTVIECEDFTEEGHRRVIDSLCSWINITGLTKSKNYTFTVYTEDKYGNQSLPFTFDATPYTSENLAALSLVSPKVTESVGSALVEWANPISSVAFKIEDYTYNYKDKDGKTMNGGGEGDLPSFLVENINPNTDINVNMTCRTVPSRLNTSDGTYSPIIDTVEWSSSIVFQVSPDAKPTIFLKAPEQAFTYKYEDRATAFPMEFSWAKISTASDYVLKFSTSSMFDTGKELEIEVGNASAYSITYDELAAFINSVPKSRNLTMYWQVAAKDLPEATLMNRKFSQTRFPNLVGKWEFNSAAEWYKATIGKDLVPVGSGDVVDSEYRPREDDKAVTFPKGLYFRLAHGLEEGGLDYYTISFLFRKHADEHQGIVCFENTQYGRTQYFIRNNGRPNLVSASVNDNYIYGSFEWHRFDFVNNSGQYSVFADGMQLNQSTSQAGRYYLEREWFDCLTTAGYSTNTVDVADIEIWDMPLSGEELCTLRGFQFVDRSEFTILDFTKGVNDGNINNILDGSYATTPWIVDGIGSAFVTLDLGKVRDLDHILIGGLVKQPALKHMVISVSEDNPSRMRDVGEVNSSQQGSLHTFIFPKDTRARYLKILIDQCYDTSANKRIHLSDIQVYEKIPQ